MPGESWGIEATVKKRGKKHSGEPTLENQPDGKPGDTPLILNGRSTKTVNPLERGHRKIRKHEILAKLEKKRGF